MRLSGVASIIRCRTHIAKGAPKAQDTAEAHGAPLAGLSQWSLTHRFPELKPVFTHHGFFQTPEEEVRVARECAATSPQLVFVALGVPRQEKWIDAQRHLFEGAVLVGIGGSIVFVGLATGGQVGAAGSRFEIVSVAFPDSGAGAQMIDGTPEAAARTLVDRLQKEARVL